MPQQKILADADEILGELAHPQDAALSIRELLRCVMLEFGGAAGLADAAKKAFDNNPTGHSNQIRLLSDLFRLLQGHGDEDEAGEDLQSLEATARQLMQRDDEGD